MAFDNSALKWLQIGKSQLESLTLGLEPFCFLKLLLQYHLLWRRGSWSFFVYFVLTNETQTWLFYSLPSHPALVLIVFVESLFDNIYDRFKDQMTAFIRTWEMLGQSNRWGKPLFYTESLGMPAQFFEPFLWVTVWTLAVYRSLLTNSDSWVGSWGQVEIWKMIELKRQSRVK